jgi:16S rRNA (guanine527-N7)-methyltransferase
MTKLTADVEAAAQDIVRASPYVSRETFRRLQGYVENLIRWQRTHNLIAPDTLREIWRRHILDSLQLFALKPDARQWVDFGSGAGLPGLVIAILLEKTNGGVILVESNRKKAAFLQHVATALSVPVNVLSARIEDVVPSLPDTEVVTARALADLTTLLVYANPLLKTGAVALFPKGRDYLRELTVAEENWQISYRLHQSITDPLARIVEIHSARHRAD